MTRILLADVSPHAQRMGERILREEGFEVVTVTDGQTALLRLDDVAPDIVFADVSLPRRSGYEICREIKNRPRHSHVRVILTAGLLDSFDESQAVDVRCDAVLKKPFEATAMIASIGPLLNAAPRPGPESSPEKVLAFPSTPLPVLTGEVDEERVRAAVTLALDAALPAMIDHLTEQILIALGQPTHARQ